MDEEIELRHLRYFLAVADCLHFSKAAERLGMAQPPLSQQIRRLELLLGCSLFERTTRGVRLTPAGTLLAERARASLRKVSGDLEQVRRVGRGEEGTLTISFSGSVMLTDLPAAIQSFRKQYPRVELRLQEMWTSEQIAALTEGRVDLAFLRDGDPTAEITMRPLLEESYVALLPQDHPLAAKVTMPMRELAGEPFVLFTQRMGSLAFERTMASCEEYGFRPEIVQEAPQWSSVARLVAAGLGVSLAPACVAQLRVPGVVYRSVTSRVRSTIDLAYKTGKDSALLANFSALAAEHLRPRKGRIK